MRAYLSRRYHFSASHRLHTSALSEASNRDIYGKCNNPHGHGHNYTVEVTFGGTIDPITGMLLNLADLDAFANRHLLAVFDTVNLNTLPAFAECVPTTENLTVAIERIFAQLPNAQSAGAQLTGLHIEETSNNSFDLLLHEPRATDDQERLQT